ncbi:unnamed protein product [Arctia plantaginis]|uniref:acid phosphatase n=1 Tax=Arctia plantaginis TaxID=874455 RepID=A0A8S1AD61_ARCPL|nr:unnamed protein product [Arctia plantaginis]
MYKILICAVIFMLSETCLCEVSILDKTELVLAFMVHRHGDRTPVKTTIQFASDKDSVLEKTKKYGYGQLTDKGRLRGYELGKFIRRRYGSQLSDQYNASEIFIRSTDSTRTKMTVLAAMAAVYPPGKDNWSKDINWTPVPYTTRRAKYDSLLPTVNCPVLSNIFANKLSKSPPTMTKYKRVMEQISNTLDINVSLSPVTLYAINDMFVSQISLGVPLPKNLEDLLPQIVEGAGQAMDILFGDDKYLSLYSGVHLQEFFDAVDKVINGRDVPRIQVYSAHDDNVFTFSSITRINPRLGVPKYGSLFSLELRRDLQTGEYIVVPVFLEEPGADEVYLQVDGCDGFCDLDSFRSLTSTYVLNETEWRTACGFSEDLDFDTSSID